MDSNRPAPDVERLEKEAAQFLKRVESRAARAAGLGCAGSVLSALLLGAFGAFKHKTGWFFLVPASVASFVLFARRATRSSADDFRAQFRSPDPARREAVVAYLKKRAYPQFGKATPSSKAARELLSQLGLEGAPRATPQPEGRTPPPVVQVPEPRPIVAAPPPRPPPHTAQPHPAAHAPSAWVRPQHTPPAHPPPVPHEPKPEPRLEPRPEPRALPVESPPTPAPAAVEVPRLAVSPAQEVRCDSCGLVRTLARGESAGLCPNCFPQIRLDG